MDFDSPPLDESIHSLMQSQMQIGQTIKPKRPPNAYNLYYIELQPIMKTENPLLGGNEISKMIGQQWSEMTEEQKRPYVEKAKEIHDQFKRENPNWHYEKSAEKQTKRNKKLSVNNLFEEFQEPLQQAQNDASNNLFLIGATALAQYILSRKDLQEDVEKFIKSQKGEFILPFEPM